MVAELTFTQAETDALSWLDLDDDALGKVVRKGMIDLANVAREQDRLLSVVASYALVGLAVQANADRLDIGLGSVTQAERAVGDWSIKVTRHEAGGTVTGDGSGEALPPFDAGIERMAPAADSDPSPLTPTKVEDFALAARRLAAVAPAAWSTDAAAVTHTSARLITGWRRMVAENAELSTTLSRLDADWERTCAAVRREYKPELAMLRAEVAALRNELDIIANATPSQWDPDMRDQFQAWAQNRARQAAALPAAPQPAEAVTGAGKCPACRSARPHHKMDCTHPTAQEDRAALDQPREATP